uniref:Uncharacterized protein n=1 Tax=Burkholderia sp. (strain CCGE1003) TaxID=640512 RepID=E1T7E8_BURSG
MNTFESFLAAKLFRISNPLKSFNPDFSKIRFVSNLNRMPGDPRHAVALFSGCFIIGTETVALPFSMAFSGRNRRPISSLAQFSYFDARLEVRILAYLSVLDFLEDIGELPDGSRAEHMRRILSKRPGARREVCDGYPAFCERAAKDLPYDLSLELLGEAA